MLKIYWTKIFNQNSPSTKFYSLIDSLMIKTIFSKAKLPLIWFTRTIIYNIWVNLFELFFFNFWVMKKIKANSRFSPVQQLKIFIIENIIILYILNMYYPHDLHICLIEINLVVPFDFFFQLPLGHRNAGKSERMLSFASSYSIVTRGSVSLSCANSPRSSCF